MVHCPDLAPLPRAGNSLSFMGEQLWLVSGAWGRVWAVVAAAMSGCEVEQLGEQCLSTMSEDWRVGSDPETPVGWFRHSADWLSANRSLSLQLPAVRVRQRGVVRSPGGGRGCCGGLRSREREEREELAEEEEGEE